MAGLRKAVNKAGLRLMYVERYEDRTVYHDFFTQYGKTKIIVRQQPPGFGVSKELKTVNLNSFETSLTFLKSNL